MTKNRINYLLLTAATIAVGLLSRKLGVFMPGSINLVLGDALYALMIFWIVRFLLPNYKTRHSALIAMAICFSIEISQLYQAQWINSIRATRLGSLVLGRGFLWSDLFAYATGAGLGLLMEKLTLKDNWAS